MLIHMMDVIFSPVKSNQTSLACENYMITTSDNLKTSIFVNYIHHLFFFVKICRFSQFTGFAN